MRMPKLALLAAFAATTITGVATAQPYRAADPHGVAFDGGGVDQNVRALQDRINRGRADGSLNRHEFMRVQGQLNAIQSDARRMRARNGGRLDDRERDMLEARLHRLSTQIRWERHNGDAWR